MVLDPDDELTASTAKDIALWLLRRRRRFRVAGRSMVPLLQPGEEVLLDPRAYGDRPPKVGDIVVAEHPTRPKFLVVKRVVAVLDTGDCLLVGDNPHESTDSRSFGAVPQDKVVGKVTSRFL